MIALLYIMGFYKGFTYGGGGVMVKKPKPLFEMY